MDSADRKKLAKKLALVADPIIETIKEFERVDFELSETNSKIDQIQEDSTKIVEAINQLDQTKADKEDVAQQIENIARIPGRPGNPGKDGKDYILTQKDKEEIATKIKVPVVEKIIEKTEVIKEQPIIKTEVVKEIKEDVAGDKIIDRINQNKDKLIKQEKIEGLDKKITESSNDTLARATSILDQRTQYLLNKRSSSRFTDLTDTFSDYIGLAGRGLRVNATEDGIDTYVATDTDEKVKYDAGDPTAGYVADKFVAGTGISLAEGTGANENKLVITNNLDLTNYFNKTTDDTDDITDTATNRFTNDTDISRLANTSGTNTGDQDLSGYAKLDGTNQPFTGDLETGAYGIQTTQIRYTNLSPAIDLSGDVLKIYDYSNNLILDGEQYQLMDSSVVSSVKFNVRNLLDSSGLVSVDWENRVLVDENGYSQVNFSASILRNQVNKITVNWDNNTLLDDNSVRANWRTQVLYKSDGTSPSFDWNNLFIDGDLAIASSNAHTAGLFINKAISSAGGASAALEIKAGITGKHYPSVYFTNQGGSDYSYISWTAASSPSGATNQFIGNIVARAAGGTNPTLMEIALSSQHGTNTGTIIQTIYGNGRVLINQSSESGQTAALNVVPRNAAHATLRLNQIAAQTAPLIEARNSSNNAVFSVVAGGYIYNRLTTKQQQWEYDASNYANITVGSTGITTFDAVGSGAKFVFSDDIDLSTKNLITDTSTGTKIGTATTQKLGFWNATPVIQQVTNAYTSDGEGSAYTGIDNAQAGTVYAQLTDLNALRVAYETLRASYDDLLTKLKNTGIVA